MRQEIGRMTERLVQMTEQSIEQGGKGARKAVEEAGFSEELKKRMEARLEESKFKSENASALAEANMPVSTIAYSGMRMLNPSRRVLAKEPANKQQRNHGAVKKA